MQFRLLFDLLADMFKYPLPTPRRIRHEMLQRLPIRSLHVVRFPSKVSIIGHRYLVLHIRQRKLTRVTRLALVMLPKSLPVFSQFRPKRLDLFNRYSPALGIKHTFFSMFIRSVVPQSGLM